MFKLCFVILFLGLSFERITGDELPSSIEKCKFDDNKCFAEAFKNVVANYASGGFNEISLDALDPVDLDDVKNKRDPNNPINIELGVKNIKFYGLSKLRISKMSKGFTKDFNGKKIDITLKIPTTNLIGDYKLDGQVLILPIQGLGKCNLTLVKPTVNLSFTGKSEIINGEEYLKADDFSIKYTTKRAIIDLQNLFNGDKALGDSMNKFLNENWEILYNELTPAFFVSVDKRIKEILQKVLYKIPYNKLFLE